MKKNLANCFTLLNLVFGFFAIINILQGFSGNGVDEIFPKGEIYWASVFILIAAVVDFLDGLIARICNAASQLGKELDSLADLVSFGVAPGLIIFQFLRVGLQQNAEANLSWYLVPAVLIPCAGAFRLARFNLSETKTTYFQGLPIPAAGLLIASLPVIFLSGSNEYFKHLLTDHIFLYFLILCVSFLMVSSIPMISLKFGNASAADKLPKYLLIVLGIIFAFIFRWMAIPYMFIIYVLLSLIVLKKEN